MQMQNNRKNRASSAPKKQKTSRSRSIRNNELVLTVPRGISTIIPDRLRTSLRWWASKPVALSTDNFAAFRFRPTGAQSPDPLVANSMIGFSQLAALYNSYRVTASVAKIEVVTTGNVPVTAVLVPTNTDPGATPTGDYVTSSRQQSFAVSTTGALAGGPIIKLTNSMSTQRMFGSKMVKFDDNFASLVNTVPNNNWFWVCTLYAAAVTDPAILNFFMELEIEFYDRANLHESV